MTWTYDPLQALNANLNLVHLGAFLLGVVLLLIAKLTIPH
jgi:predicted GNAT superfamily acetyltransferase